MVAKVSDYGLAREVKGDGVYHFGKDRKVAFKWMAFETLTKGNFSTMSDVWYGVFLDSCD